MKNENNMGQMKNTNYGKFFLMLAISSIIMYAVMFLNMDKLGDYHTSATRIYMALLMVMPMAIVMITMMGKMYTNRKRNTAIVVGAVLLFSLLLTALRTQTPIGDIQYMKAMIPHHSSAIMVSKNADIKDAEVRNLADSIIASQEREIVQMEDMIRRLSR